MARSQARTPSKSMAPVTTVPLDQTTRQRYLNYALSVITARALPDVRDGLKPVQRRILFFHVPQPPVIAGPATHQKRKSRRVGDWGMASPRRFRGL